MLRQAQHERKIFNNFRINPVRPEPVEGRGSILSPQIKKETYMSLSALLGPLAIPMTICRSDILLALFPVKRK